MGLSGFEERRPQMPDMMPYAHDRPGTPPAEQSVDELDGLLHGGVQIDAALQTIASLINNGGDHAARIHEMIEVAHREGRLNKDHYETLAGELDQLCSEDHPTQWSEDVALACVTSGDPGPAESCGEPPVLMDKVARFPRPAASGLLPGTTLQDRFVLISQFEAGGMGEVYKALDLRKKEIDASDPWVALKLLKQPYASHPELLNTLRREAVTTRRLSHPNIVRVHDFDRADGHCFMTMEWLEGMSLVDLLDQHPRQPLPHDQAMRIIRDIGHGLAHAHTHGVVHADIKPGNVFLTRTGDAKLVDFGIARVRDDAHGDANLAVHGAHTPAYSSCEVLEGTEPVERDDVYSLGCIAYRLLAGFRPAGTLTALEAEDAGFEPRRIESISERQWQVLRHALAYRRDCRTRDVATFLEEFFRPEPEPPAAEPDLPDLHASGQERDRVVEPKILGGIVMFALLLLLAVAMLWPAGEPPPAATASLPVLTSRLADEPLVVPPVTADSDARLPVGPPDELFGPAETELGDIVPPTPQQAFTEEPVGRDPAVGSPRAESQSAQERIKDPATATAPEQPSGRPAANMPLAAILAEPVPTDFAPAAPRRSGTPETAEPAATSTAPAMLPVAMPGEPRADDVAPAAPRRSGTPETAEPVATATAPAMPPVAIAGEPRADDVAPAVPRRSGTPETAEPAATSTAPAGSEPAGQRRIAAAGRRTGIQPSYVGEVSIVPVDWSLEGLTAEMAGELPDEPDGPALPEEVALSKLVFERYVEPEYPRRSRLGRVSGWVTVRFTITTDGSTRNLEVVEAEPRGRFEDAAIAAIGRWRFEPLLADGIPVEKSSVIRVRFEPD